MKEKLYFDSYKNRKNCRKVRKDGKPACKKELRRANQEKHSTNNFQEHKVKKKHGKYCADEGAEVNMKCNHRAIQS